MSLSRHALLALLVAAVAAAAGIAVWTNGRVDIGLRLEAVDGVVRVADVTPDGIAARAGVFPGQVVTFIQTVDGREVAGTQVRHQMAGETDTGEVITKTIRLPGEAVDEGAISVVELGFDDGSTVYSGVQLARDEWVRTLFEASWLIVIGLAVGAVTWFALSRGAAGAVGRDEAVMLGAAVATPLAIMPVVLAGTAQGIGGGYLAAGAAALVAGSALAGHHPERAWQRAGRVTGAVLLALTALLVIRYLAAPTLSVDMRGQIAALITATGLVPALIAAGGASRIRDRASLVSLGLLPGVAGSVVAIGGINLLPLLVMAALLGWQLLPLGRLAAAARAVLPTPAAAPASVAAVDADPQVTERRDIVALLLGGLAVIISAAQENAWTLIIGLILGGLAAYALRRGFLGPGWIDAAAPIGVAIAIPILMVGAGTGYGDGRIAVVLATLAALLVAHLVAWRHPDPAWRGRHFAAAAVLAAFAVVQANGDGSGGPLVLSGLVPLVPALSLAFVASRPGSLAVVGRMETLVVAATPGIAMLAMVNGPGVLILLAWFAAVLVWRRFTLAPLLGIAQRTQQQLDLAVAAAEQERARLAADLHDDALQELTGLVRRLDAAGDAESAEMARGVAERLRGITSDLRLPLLDDLGAGPALEWLVARVRPMAGGEVRLERSDPSRPPSAVELAVFRVAQEALANAMKHGKAPITVRYHVDEAGHVSLTVDDAGPGIDLKAAEGALASGHLGMANMQQRAEQIGALLNVRAWPTGGTHVGLEWRPQ